MIYVDPRAGSAELVEPLKRRGLPVHVERLEYGDLSWVGNGPDGPQLIGVEFKTLADVLQCITSKRFAEHQLPGLQDRYAVAYLLIEGVWRQDDEGRLLELGHRGWTPTFGRTDYRALEHWLATVEQQGGVVVVRAGAARRDCLAWIHAQYSWWTSKSWADHRTIAKAYREVRPRAARLALVRPPRPSRIERLWAQLFGWELAKVVAQRFPNVGAAMGATDKQWLAIPGVGPEMLRRWRSVA